jgi:uncharacterized protein YjbJ (UPF0337 family)
MKNPNEDTRSSTTDKIEGNSKIAAGSVKEATGRVVHSPKLEGRGIAERTEGHIQKRVGEIKKVFGE